MTEKTATPKLESTSRTVVRKQVNQLRATGLIPAVLYGHNQENLSLSLDQHSFEKLYHEVGSTTLLSLSVDGTATGKVLVHDVQTNPITHSITHVDLYKVNLKEKLTTEIPLSFVGVADAVEILGGTLLTVRDIVEIECFPDDLVQEIEVDISSLKTFDDAIHVSDLIVPSTIQILDDPEQMIASVNEPRSEEELAELEEAPVAEVETEFETKEGTIEAPEEGAKEE